jgi:hypothetical protein
VIHSLNQRLLVAAVMGGNLGRLMPVEAPAAV